MHPAIDDLAVIGAFTCNKSNVCNNRSDFMCEIAEYIYYLWCWCNVWLCANSHYKIYINI